MKINSFMKKGVIGILAMATICQINPPTAFAETRAYANLTERQQTMTYAQQFIQKNPGNSTTDSAFWNSSTQIVKTVPLYDFVENINSYLIRLKTDGIKQGFLIVDLTSSGLSTECFCRTGQHAADTMMQKRHGTKISANDHIIHAGAFDYEIKEKDQYVDLDTGNLLTASQQNLQKRYEQNQQKIEKAAQLAQSQTVKNLTIKPDEYISPGYKLSVPPVLYTISFWPSDDNNCAPTACMNFLYYWKQYKPQLWGANIYPELKDRLGWTPTGGVSTNQIIPALEGYANSRNTPIAGEDYRVWGSIDWSFLTRNIYHGIPILIAYQKNSPMFRGVGHEVVCFGYTTTNKTPYLYLADGFSTSLVKYAYNNAAYMEETCYVRWNT